MSERGVGFVVRAEVVCMRGREGLLGEFPGLHLYDGAVSVVSTVVPRKDAAQTHGFAIYDAGNLKW